MPHRRQFLQSVSASALAAPWLPGTAAAEDAGAPSLPSTDDPAYWVKLRDQFLLARDKVFFNNGTIGAMPRVVLDQTVDHLRRMAIDIADWDYRGPNWIGGYGPMEQLRTKAAHLVNADWKEIALTENVTCANSYIAAGLDLPAGVEILMSDQEHPGGESPWLTAAKRHGGAVVKVALPRPAHHPEELVALVRRAFTPRTRVLYLSHVITGSGAIVPVKEICAEARSRGIFTVIDGAQALGHIPVDVRDIGCDAYVACFHKWLLAPAGNGFLYIRRDRAKDVWTTLASGNWNNHDDDGYRLTQRGTGSLSLLVGAEAALDFHFAHWPGPRPAARQSTRRPSARRSARNSQSDNLLARRPRHVRGDDRLLHRWRHRAASAGRDVEPRPPAPALARQRRPSMHPHLQQHRRNRSHTRYRPRRRPRVIFENLLN